MSPTEIKRDNFPKEAVEQTVQAAKIKASSYLSRRTDLRSKELFAFVSSPQENAECAFSLSKTRDGWQLGVHVADVCEYVVENSPLDVAVAKRSARINNGFSKSEMLPDILVNDICNLAKDEEKLALSVFLDISPDGELQNIKFEESVLKNGIICLYDEVEQILLTQEASAVHSLRKKYSAYFDSFGDMYELAAIFCGRRLSRLGLDCTNYSRVYSLDDEGKITSCRLVAEPDSRAMVREIGYFVAEAVGEFMLKKNLPCIFNGKKSIPQYALDYLSNLVELETEETAPEKLAAMIAEKAKGNRHYPFVCMALSESLPASEHSVSPTFNAFCGCDHIVSFFHPATKYTDLLIQRILKTCIAAKGETANLNLNRQKKAVCSAADAMNKAEEFIYNTQKHFARESALELLENSTDEEFYGFPLYLDESGAVPVVLECGLKAIVPKEYAENFDFLPGHEARFQIIALGTNEEAVVVKPV